ncbi:hypothetical protein XBO1_2480023 [Xenorhabdus bovienii str. oregonense]|uniref:Uncharacterized protein n=1 Tax=Xenorhabdus bovienii str. oregonense TaxID=1398202 RepID=A0A077PAW2_XENBV|nr:hypothetical protein XBO1_2480023 [Xenorhabdus bovienii str. oregonense]
MRNPHYEIAIGLSFVGFDMACWGYFWVRLISAWACIMADSWSRWISPRCNMDLSKSIPS